MTTPHAEERSGNAVAHSGKKLFRILFLITILLSLAAAICQTALFLNHYDESLKLYERGETPTVFYIICTVIGLLLLLSELLFRKKTVPEHLAQPGKLINFAALFCGFFLASSILLYLIYYLSGLTPDMSLLRVAAVVTAFPASLYFLITALSAQPNRKLLALSGFCVIIWGILFLLNFYFDTTIPITSASRPLGYFSIFAVMIYFLMELRFLVGNAKPRRYLSVSLTAIFVLSLTGVPNFILIATGLRTSNDSIFHIAQVCMLFYILARMISVMTGRAFLLPAEYAAEEMRPEEPVPQDRPDASVPHTDPKN